MGLSHDTHVAYTLVPDLCRVALDWYNCGEQQVAAVLFAEAHKQLQACVDVYWDDNWSKYGMLKAIEDNRIGNLAGLKRMLEDF